MKRIVICLLAALMTLGVSAKIKLPALVDSNMVLQRNTEVKLWGEASPSKKVTVTTSWNNKTYYTTSDSEGKWSVMVETTDAGGPYNISISDGEKVLLDNILLGEVWICLGQSNMEMPVGGFVYQPVEGSAQVVSEANLWPQIRMFTVPRAPSETPLFDTKGVWKTSSPASVSEFSATGYFFGRMLNQVLNIPIGLITSNWGGSAIEAWMSEETVNSLQNINQEVAHQGKGNHNSVARLYNGMIVPLQDFTAKGFIWYQGCSNRHNWYDYKELQVAFVKMLREKWGNDKMPFYAVQLAPYKYEGDNLRSLPLVIEAQYQAMAELPYTGIAATTDIGNRLCIHPEFKKQVGDRLAWLALANDYAIKGVPASAPTYKSMERKENKLVLSFNHLSDGSANEPNSIRGYYKDSYIQPKGFEIAGEDKVFRPAKANVVWWKNQIEVWSDEVPNPVAVRYAFVNFPADANIETTFNLPLVPFRTDNWIIPAEEIGEIK